MAPAVSALHSKEASPPRPVIFEGWLLDFLEWKLTNGSSEEGQA